ncbi:MAG: ABC transporter substrate-binding protein [Candidatus Hodarchaeales archaeon]
MQKITYYLHDGYEWHDGQPLTSEDVAFSYQLINESNSPSLTDSVDPVTHVETPNATTVEIFCDVGGLFTFHRTSVPIFPKHIWESVSNPLTWSNPDPVGSGPYKWRSRTPGELVVLERNDDYFYNPRNYEYPSQEGTTTTTTTTDSGVTETTSESTTTTTTNTPGFELFVVFSGFAVIAIIDRKRRK